MEITSPFPIYHKSFSVATEGLFDTIKLMGIVESIILGAVQGITEFVPVSSSGHLVLVRELLGINNSIGLAYDAVLHLATALAVLIYFREDILRLIKTFIAWLKKEETEKEDLNLIKALIVGTIPVVLIAFIFENFIGTEIREPLVVVGALVAGSIIFLIAEQTAEKNRKINARRGFWTGLAQVLALIPGMSRSGITIAGGLFTGLTREMAAKFSFLLGFPIIAGAGLKKLLDIGSTGLLGELGLSLIIGSVVAFIMGYLSIDFMMKYLKKRSLLPFIIYRILLAVAVFIIVV